MSASSCKNCGSSDIEFDPARGDAVCTSCGSVLESNIIVSEVQFQENANGTSSAIGTFVSSDATGASSYGGAFRGSSESREITLRKARQNVALLCQQLLLTERHINTAYNLFKLALTRQLTRGRRNTHIIAACVYIMCRIEKSPTDPASSILLIDISDKMQVCCYELMRTYLRLTTDLDIHPPSIEPGLYIMRFASRLELGDKTEVVAHTAQRLIKRMKKDNIHSGRRPSGLCGAALLMAARLHGFSRTTNDIVKIVKIHESTIKKRLFEFGDTPSSALTLEEFMTVDLEQVQDPPAFKAARKKDKERLIKLNEEGIEEITEMRRQIEHMLQESNKNKRLPIKYKDVLHSETEDTRHFIEESNLSVIQECIVKKNELEEPKRISDHPEGLGPDINSMGLVNDMNDCVAPGQEQPVVDENEVIDLDGLDEDEIDSYIMTDSEAKYKDNIWNELNADYLEEQKIRKERLAKEIEEGKPEKKRRTKKKPIGESSSAGEAIEKMLQGKKISKKINYDVLNDLKAELENKTDNNENSFASSSRKRKPTDNDNESANKKVCNETNMKLEPKAEQSTENNATVEESECEDDYYQDDVVDPSVDDMNPTMDGYHQEDVNEDLLGNYDYEEEDY